MIKTILYFVGCIALGYLLGAGAYYLIKPDTCTRGRDNLQFMEVCSTTPGCTYSMQDFKQTAKDLNTCPNGIQGELDTRKKKETKGAIL